MSDLGDFTDFDGDDDGDDGDDGGSAADETATAASSAETDGTATDTDPLESTDDKSEAFAEMDVTPAGEDHGVGVISATEGLRISEDGEETELRAYVTVESRSDVRIGKYLLVPYQDGERLFCRITALEYAQEFRADDATEIHARPGASPGGRGSRRRRRRGTPGRIRGQ